MIAVLAVILAIAILYLGWLDRCLNTTNDRVAELERQAIERR